MYISSVFFGKFVNNLFGKSILKSFERKGNIMRIYNNTLLFIISLLMIIKLVNGVTIYPIQMKLCIESCSVFFGVNVESSNWNRYYGCLRECSVDALLV